MTKSVDGQLGASTIYLHWYSDIQTVKLTRPINVVPGKLIKQGNVQEPAWVAHLHEEYSLLFCPGRSLI